MHENDLSTSCGFNVHGGEAASNRLPVRAFIDVLSDPIYQRVIRKNLHKHPVRQTSREG
jgi:hypothetical protein